MKFAETETLILRIHVLFVSTLPVALEKTCDSLGDEGKRNVNALDLLKVAPTFWRPQSVHHRNIWGETLKWGHPQSSSIDRWFKKIISHPAIGDPPLMEKPVWKDLRWSLACMVEV